MITVAGVMAAVAAAPTMAWRLYSDVARGGVGWQDLTASSWVVDIRRPSSRACRRPTSPSESSRSLKSGSEPRDRIFTARPELPALEGIGARWPLTSLLSSPRCVETTVAVAVIMMDRMMASSSSSGPDDSESERSRNGTSAPRETARASGSRGGIPTEPDIILIFPRSEVRLCSGRRVPWDPSAARPLVSPSSDPDQR